jgi:flagellar biosynthesis GTPase FlhF
LQTNAELCNTVGQGSCLAACLIKVVNQRRGEEDWSSLEALPIAHGSDFYIRKKRPPPSPAPGPAPEDVHVASERREAHDRHEAMERVRELENERQRKARAKEEKRRKDEEEERRRVNAEHAAQAAARAAAREPAPWPANMPLRGEGSDVPARARRETEKAEALARVAEHKARLCEQEEERTKEALRQMQLLRVGDLIQKGDGE